jgi:hypothetical protein
VPGASGVTKWPSIEPQRHTSAPTAEGIASYLGWDNDAPIDVSVEINLNQALDPAPDWRQRVPDAPSRR